jgi:hypothetical protein
MNREVHVRICESLGVGFPWATRPYVLVGKTHIPDLLFPNLLSIIEFMKIENTKIPYFHPRK